MAANGETVESEGGAENGGEERAVVLNTKPLFKLMVDKRASDLFFTSYAPIKIKIESTCSTSVAIPRWCLVTSLPICRGSTISVCRIF
jgi:hypothetical protein